MANVTEIHDALNFTPRRQSAGGSGDDDEGHWGGFGERAEFLCCCSRRAFSVTSALLRFPGHTQTLGQPLSRHIRNPPPGIWSVAWSPGGGEIIAGEGGWRTRLL